MRSLSVDRKHGGDAVASWSRKFRGESIEVAAEFNPWPINRPRLNWYWYDEYSGTLALEWGNGNSDPVWSLSARFSVPGWIDRWLIARKASS